MAFYGHMARQEGRPRLRIPAQPAAPPRVIITKNERGEIRTYDARTGKYRYVRIIRS